MEQILTKEFRETLRDSLIIAKIPSEEATNIVEKQYKKALKNAAIARLKEVIEALEKENYALIEDALIAYSPAGDGYGCNNYYIDFMEVTENCEDIKDIIDALSSSLYIE
jgi:hypothetical protein